jgi:hypothetical protein
MHIQGSQYSFDGFLDVLVRTRSFSDQDIKWLICDPLEKCALQLYPHLLSFFFDIFELPELSYHAFNIGDHSIIKLDD